MEKLILEKYRIVWLCIKNGIKMIGENYEIIEYKNKKVIVFY